MSNLLVLALLEVACTSKESAESTAPGSLKSFPIDGTETVLTQSGVTFDQGVTADGNGSLKLEATQPTTFHLFEITDVDIEDARIFYRAKLRTENVSGAVFLEMWCVFPDKGEFFSRGLENPLTGTVEWSSAETPFLLEKGQKPSLIKLNVAFNGVGTAWVDDISLDSGPLQ